MADEASFESDLRQLEKTVKSLEGGELGLDAAAAHYEGGIKLLARCHARLEDAGRKVALLAGVSNEGEPETAPFDATATTEAAPRLPRPSVGEDGGGLDGVPF